MEIINKNNNRTLLILLFISLIIWGIYPLVPFVFGDNESYVLTTLHINNSPPYITNIVINSNITDSGEPITLVAGSNVTVYCNGTITDLEGYDTINLTNATLYFVMNKSEEADDNNVHYTNSSCSAVAGTETAINQSYQCAFIVQYYANNGTWICNMTVKDEGNLTGSTEANESIDPLYAIEVPGNISYGEVAVLETSLEQEKNITNYGNIDFNLTLWGYGGQDNVTGDTLSMVCKYGNITIDSEKYSFTNDTNFTTEMTSLTNNAVITNLTINQRVDDSQILWNQTYWRIDVPSLGAAGPAGDCNGTVVFAAWSY